MSKLLLYILTFIKQYKTGYITGLVLLACITSSQAQIQQRGKLEVVKDPRVDTLIAHRYSRNRSTGKITKGISAYGYRVQFFSGVNRKDAFDAQNRFQQMHPELRTYINYSEPNFKVKGGDFRTRLEATKLMQELKGKFSRMYIISEKINPPKLIDPNVTTP